VIAASARFTYYGQTINYPRIILVSTDFVVIIAPALLLLAFHVPETGKAKIT
jgi:hypothetical protein